MKAIKGKRFRRGIHIADKKQYAADAYIEVAPVPQILSISMSQHIGKPCQIVVQVGDEVKQGQLIGKADGFVSANVYSGVSGKVIGIEKRANPRGMVSDYVVIENDGQYDSVCLEPLADREPNTIKERIREAGIVGMGGAGFPTAVKLSPSTPVDTLVINGAECEPYLTCDYRLMIEKTEEVVSGIRLLAKALGVDKIIVGIEANKPKAIELLEKYDDLTIVTLKKAYPMGSEKHLIYCCTGREVPVGKLPADAGCVVQNIATAYAVYEAVELNKPLYERVLTVSGECVKEPKNLLVKFGTSFQYLLDYCKYDNTNLAALIAGGPMMGSTMISSDYYTRKTDSGILALDDTQADFIAPSPCISCGRCASVCPMHLLPMSIDFYTQAGDYQSASKYGGVLNCIECGCCAYVCPARRSLLQSITLCKSQLRKK